MAAKRVRMTAQERREQLVGVARSVFATRGFEATSIEEIAERAGVSKPVVYQHFGGKEGVYAVVVDREVRRLTGSIVQTFDAPSPRMIAEGAADAFLGYIEDHEEGFRVLIRDAPIGMTSGSFGSVIADVATRAERLLIDEFSDRGFDDETAPMYALMLVGAVALVGEWWLEHRRLPREQVAAHVVNLLWNGLHDLEPQPPVSPPRRVEQLRADAGAASELPEEAAADEASGVAEGTDGAVKAAGVAAEAGGAVEASDSAEDTDGSVAASARAKRIGTAGEAAAGEAAATGTDT